VNDELPTTFAVVERTGARPHCCFTGDAGDCGAPATHSIGPDDSDPYSSTHSCDGHISDLLPERGARVTTLVDAVRAGEEPGLVLMVGEE
jgi:hypothetical protein